ncbi:MAG: glycolate oxidase subunit GlcE [Gammaproteobacteria bacterium]|nr:glycolate oxidase subunit GlcE [Gammaproteobacteria bacterium]
MIEHDDSARLLDTIGQALKRGKSLSIHGHGSKAHYVSTSSGERLETSDHCGVLEYRPDELTISVRAGTPIRVIEQILANENQMLACDPPQFDGLGTIGGAAACGLSGPGRPWYGNFRDAVLGIEVVNGHGERLKFGGTVMKNVAGFDVSRLFIGSLGVLGLILSVNLRVQPRPQIEKSIEIAADADSARRVIRQSIGTSTPITATSYYDGNLQLRLSGIESSIEAAQASMQDAREIDNDCWIRLRDHTHPFFKDKRDLRFAWPNRGSPWVYEGSAARLIEWSGGQVWFNGASNLVDLDQSTELSQPFDRTKAMNGGESKYTRRLRQAFDPNRIFNADLNV